MAVNMNNTIVIDCSVVIKWFVEEEADRIQAENVRRDFSDGKVKILVPAVLFWEFNNYMRRKFDEKTATSLFSNLKNYLFTLSLPNVESAALAFKIMKNCPKASYYDASYHALALHEEGTFVTSDNKYYQAAKSFGHIKLLRDY